MSVCYFFALANFEPFSEKIYFLVVPLAAGQVYSSTSWVCHWVSQKVENVRKLKISVNIDARTLKFGMEHPWAHWLWFRKNQFEGPCEDHVLAIKGPYFGHFYEKGTMGYTQNCKIWHEASLGTYIMIKEEPIRRTMWGPCFGHKRAIFWPFLGKVDFWIHPELWNLAGSIPGKMVYDKGRINLKDHVRTMFWP